MDRGTLTKRLASELADQDDVVAAYLFGSSARGQARRADSDVDVGVLFTDTPPTVERLFRRIEIARRLEASLEVPVDVVDLRAAPPHLNHQVLTEGVLLKGRESPARIEFEQGVRRDYFDLLPYRRRHYEQSVRRLREGGGGLGAGSTGPGALEAARELHRRLAGRTRDQ